MKDSGVEWLGEVPEHWDVTRLKYLVESYEQGWSPQCENRQAEEGEYGVLKVGCVNGGVFSPNENKALPVELEPRSRYSLAAGDFLISRANTKELVGSAAVIEQDWPKLLLCDKLYRLRFKGEVKPNHICNYMMSHPVREQLELSATGASDSMQNIGQSAVLELSIPMPPPKEATALVQHLKQTLARLKAIEEKSDESVKLLKEHRSALITAAVTGQIDVRNLA
jgi:type I restriction enzyme S subunit